MSSIRCAVLTQAGEDWRVIAVPGGLAERSKSRRGALRCVLIVPGASIHARWLPLKGSTPAQIRGTALALFAPNLATPVEDCIAVLGEASGDARMVCVAARADVGMWISIARANGFDPDLVTPDFAVLSSPADGSINVATNGDDVVVRGSRQAFACQRDILPLLVADQQITETDLERELFEAVASGSLFTAPNFAGSLPAAERGDRIGRLWPRVAASALVALVLAAAAPWTHAFRLDAATRDMKQEAEAIARQALPSARRIVNARAQLEEALLPYRHGEALLNITAALLQGLALSPGVAISQLDVAAEAELRARLHVSGMDDLAPLREELAGKGLEATETVGGALAGSTTVDLVVRRAP
ncbi:MAG: type II secretion system protein GspL [Alphaproteobacteria bacterium]|nr:type II secretion system protein GspL [Alphaproteobacteria bacterium]